MNSTDFSGLRFDFATARGVHFGAGRAAEIAPRAAALGRRAVIVAGAGAESPGRGGRLAQIEKALAAAGVASRRVAIGGEPTIEIVDEAVSAARGHAGERPELVIAIGGGSVMDAGKAIAALLANGGGALDYLEGVGRGKVLEKAALPCIAVPTTAGTGSEVTKNAVIGNASRTFKKSMRAEGMLPVAAIVDAELTWSCGRGVTAACGMDAVTQLIEPLISLRANPMTDALALRGLRSAAALGVLIGADEARLVAGDGAAPDAEIAAAREAMALASVLGGICLANAGLGAVHGLAAPLGSYFDIPHGAICAALLPAVVRANARQAELEGMQQVGKRLMQAAETLFGERLAPEAFAERLAGWHAAAGLPRLGDRGVGRGDFTRIAAEARGNSMKTNPVTLSDGALASILAEAL